MPRSVAVLFLAPALFEVAFQNKFQGGLAVLPLTLGLLHLVRHDRRGAELSVVRRAARPEHAGAAGRPDARTSA